jgi:hypothetical protein
MDDSYVFIPLALTFLLFIVFIVWELCVAAEPILPPFLLLQRVPLLVGLSDFLVALSNFAIAYFFPMWFQVVMLKSASEAGTQIFSTCSVTWANVSMKVCIFFPTASLWR